jgi:PAS domain S-box-containing protein
MLELENGFLDYPLTEFLKSRRRDIVLIKLNSLFLPFAVKVTKIKKTRKGQSAPSVRTKEAKGRNAKSVETKGELENSLSLLRATLESTADGILVVDRAGKIVTYNQKFVDMWSIPASIMESRDDTRALEFVLGQLRNPDAFVKRVEELYKQPDKESYDVLEFKDGRIFERYSQPQRVGETIVGRVWSFRDVTDRKCIERELEDREKKLKRQNEVLLELASGRILEQGNLDAALREIAEAAARTLDVERVNIWLYDDTRSRVVCIEQYELSGRVHSKGYELSAADYPCYFKALEEERIIAAHDAHTDPRTREFSSSYLAPFGITSLLDAPIRVEGRMVGLICHENVGPARQWSIEEQHFAGSMADFISLAIEAWERKTAEEALKESLAQLSKKSRYESSISTVTRSVHQSLNLEDVLENAVDAMSKNVGGAENVGIWLVEGEEAVIKAFRGFPDWFIREVSRIPYPKGATWRTIIEGKPTYSPDAEKDNILGPAGIKLGTKSYLSMPIHFAGTTVGVININSFEKNTFDEEELKLLEIVAQQIESAINNAKQAEALKKSEEALRESLAQLSKKNRYETIISTVIRSIHQSTNLQDVIDNAVQAIMENIDRADSVAIYFVEGEEAVMKAQKGYSEWYLERVGRIPYPKGYAWKVIMDEQPRYCADVDEDTVIGPAGREFGIKSYLSMPIQFEGKTIGVINVNSFERNAFDEDELKLLEIVREQITVALGNTRQRGALQEALSEVESLKRRLQAENLFFHGDAKAEHSFEEIIGRSPLLMKVLLKVEHVATTDSALLIEGEKGTGKELIARSVHKLSPRRHNPFVRINCSEFPKNQIEGELFGREEKGGFSGALSLSIGRFELANGGTVFLDEIYGLPFEIQSKLLRVLQEGEFKRLGGSNTVKVDIRLITATSHDLEQALKSGLLSEELYNELKAFQIKIPPLRDRKEDIPLLVKHFVNKYGSRIGKNVGMLPQGIMDTLLGYDWPGNVRELESVIEKAIISADDMDLGEMLSIH